MNTATETRIFFTVAAVLALGCDLASDRIDPADLDPEEEAAEIVENLRLAGYPESEIEARADGVVIVGGDAVVSLAASREMVASEDQDGPSFRQYRTNNLVSKSKNTICVNGAAFTGTLSTGLDRAIANYTNLDLTFNMVRTAGSTVGCDATIVAFVVAGEQGLAEFPAGGNPNTWIEIGSGVANYGVAVSTQVITHELGHCLGFRHTDYYNPDISCGQGGSGGNEGDAGVGAVHIPGTPTTATYNGSIMNSCYNSGSTGVWTANDLTALKELYGLGPFGSAVSSFAGTLDVANLDGSGHFLVGAADVTGDHRADLVSVSVDGSAYVWPGQVNGSFGSAVSSFAGSLDLANLDGYGHFIVDVADVTGDGRADLVSAHSNGSAYVWPGQANGGFGGAVASFAGSLDVANIDGKGHYLLAAADVTGDGRADLVSSHTNGSAYVWPGLANGGFGGAVASFGGTLDMANLDKSGHFIVDLADVTGDGRADLVSSHTNGSAYVWPGLASGSFGGAVASFAGSLDMANLDAFGHYLISVADVSGDGRADLVSSHTNGSAYVWPGQANGGFGGASSSFNGTLDMANIDMSGHFILDAADVTGDGRADLVSAHTNRSAYVWLAQ
ncbi:MAG: VCBS repeat-containing protein [Nannocystis sp.]|uniref:M57 family metalloprotease n=1 Tax=Nannocystis sp. TaxID=1962667 RepID=UPI0024263354|nr:M57 family metalloprotease [Nannocystis sp.]MBK9752765.1 VCBS repeat-containing protein [Nannocystis sp.]